jgi:hypothetical protein
VRLRVTGDSWTESTVKVMDVRRMDALSDWDDWEDEPEWWLRHPLHRPHNRRADNRPCSRNHYPQTGTKRTLA